MSTALERLQDFAAWVGKGRVALPEVSTIPPEQCRPPGSIGGAIEKDRDYITINVNELFLSAARKGWAVYDPMVLVTTSLIYDDKRITIPAMVGPTLIAQGGQKVPQGVILNDTTVAGPYPYRGGSVAISIVLYRVRQQDYALSLLRLVEGIASAVGPSADMGVLGKIGGTLIDGLERILGMGETEPIAGHRIEISSLKPSGLRTSFSALIADGSGLATRNLRVVGGRLRVGGNGAEPTRYEATDYVLYSVNAAEARQDESTLGFYPLYKRALADAARGHEEAWKSAKATFAELWQQMILSPDLTRNEARRLLQFWQSELVKEYELAKNRRMLSVDRVPTPDERLKGAAAILDLGV